MKSDEFGKRTVNSQTIAIHLFFGGGVHVEGFKMNPDVTSPRCGMPSMTWSPSRLVTFVFHNKYLQKKQQNVGSSESAKKNTGNWWYHEEQVYPPVDQHGNRKSPVFIGYTSSKRPFSIAILVYRSVDRFCVIQLFSQPNQTFVHPPMGRNIHTSWSMSTKKNQWNDNPLIKSWWIGWNMPVMSNQLQLGKFDQLQLGKFNQLQLGKFNQLQLGKFNQLQFNLFPASCGF